jgi:signal peptidase I
VPKKERRKSHRQRNEAGPVDEKPRETTVEFLASLAGVLVTGLFIITFVLQAFEIPSSSMEDTLLIGDHVFVNREQFAPPTHWMGPLMPYRDIRHGDIVVFLSPGRAGPVRGEAHHRRSRRPHSPCAMASCTATARSWTSRTSSTKATLEPLPRQLPCRAAFGNVRG